MGKKKLTAYWLLLTAVLMTAVMVLSVGQSQARYINTVTWDTVLEPGPGVVSSNCMAATDEPQLTVLLGQIPLEEEHVITFQLDAIRETEGQLNWQITKNWAKEYMDVRMELGGQTLNPGDTVKLDPGSTEVTMIFAPTELARTREHGVLIISVEVSWADSLSTVFQVKLPALKADSANVQAIQLLEPQFLDNMDNTILEYSINDEEPRIGEENEEEPTEEEQEEDEELPTEEPVQDPTEAPSEEPTEEPTEDPVEDPTEAPTEEPTEAPSEAPTEPPTEAATEAPAEAPSEEPTEEPTEAPTEEPTDPAVVDDIPIVDGSDVIWMDAPADMKEGTVIPVIIKPMEDQEELTFGLLGEMEDGLQPLPAFTRYSPDGGASWYMLYDADTVKLDFRERERITLLLNTGYTELEPEAQLTLAAGCQSDDAIRIAPAAVTVPNGTALYTMSSRIMTEKDPLTLTLPRGWERRMGDYTFSYRLYMQAPAEETGYMEVAAELLYAQFEAGEENSTLTFRADEYRPQAGTYRLDMEWKYKGICFAQEQTTFFINYSTYSESYRTGGAEQ